MHLQTRPASAPRQNSSQGGTEGSRFGSAERGSRSYTCSGRLHHRGCRAREASTNFMAGNLEIYTKGIINTRPFDAAVPHHVLFKGPLLAYFSSLFPPATVIPCCYPHSRRPRKARWGETAPHIGPTESPTPSMLRLTRFTAHRSRVSQYTETAGLTAEKDFNIAGAMQGDGRKFPNPSP